MIDPVKPAGEKAPAEGHFQPVPVFRRSGCRLFRQGPVDGAAIDGGYRGDVVGRLEAALDLEGAEAHPDQFRDLVDGRQVLGREKIGAIPEILGAAIHFERVGEPAGLGAFSAVCTAAAKDLAGQTLPGVGDTKGSMDKHLQGKSGGVGCGRELGQFPQGKFPRENGKMEALAAGEGDTLRRGEGHLCGGVQFEVWANGLGQADESEVLDNQGVDLG